MWNCYFSLNAKSSCSLDLYSHWVCFWALSVHILCSIFPRDKAVLERQTRQMILSGPRLASSVWESWKTERLAPCMVDASQRPSNCFVKLGMNVLSELLLHRMHELLPCWCHSGSVNFISTQVIWVSCVSVPPSAELPQQECFYCRTTLNKIFRG